MSDRPSLPPRRAVVAPRATNTTGNPRSRAREPRRSDAPSCSDHLVPSLPHARPAADQPATAAMSRDGPGLTALGLGFSAECAESKEITTRM